MCHSVGRSGGGGLNGVPSFFTIARERDFAQVKRSLETGITSGHPAMPKVTLSGTEIEAILAYLTTLRQP
jgi:hypothetical protein